MELNITTKWILAIVATILLGALGSGLWSLVFDPLLKWFGKFFMSISTLGLRSIQNSLYAEIAVGHRDRGVRILILILFMGITIPVISIYSLENRNKLLDEEMRQAVNIVKNQNVSEDEIEKEISIVLDKLRAERRDKAKIKITFMASFLLCVLFFQYFKIVLIESSVSRFERYINICLPYFSGDEKKIAKSNFALIKNKEDYFAVIANLNEIAERGDITLPR